MIHRSCSLLVGLALVCSQTVGSAQLSEASKEKVGALGSKTPKVAPAHPTGFSDIAPYLNADGAMLSFYDTREIVAAVDGVVSLITQAISQAASQDESAKVAMKVFTLVYENSGVKSLAAMGSSSVPRGNQLHYTRKYLARIAGDKKPGFLWNALTETNAPLSGLNLLPATTAWAAFGNVDFAYLDSLISKVSAETGSADGARSFKEEVEKLGVKWEEILASLDHELGVVLLLDPKKNIVVPAGPTALELPHPSVGIVVRVKNHYLYQRIKELTGPKGPKEAEVEGVKLLSQPMPHPVVPDLAFTVAMVDQYLVVSSSRDFPVQLAATLRGKSPGLLASEEFKGLSQDVPLEGSAFSFTSKRFSDATRQVADLAIATVAETTPSDGIKRISRTMMTAFLPQPSLTVYERVGADWLVTSNGPQETPMGITANAGTIGMLSAIAVPNFIRARTRSQATQILEGARLLDAAVDQYAIENNLKSGAPVAFKDVVPYLRKNSPLALSGGKDVFGRPYILKPVDGGIRIHPETIQQIDKTIAPREFFAPYVD